jgi:hypothetical protein
MFSLFSLVFFFKLESRHPSYGREKKRSFPVRLTRRRETALIEIVLERPLAGAKNREDNARLCHCQQLQPQGLS